MKKDSFNNNTSRTNSGGGDMSSLINIFKMLSSNKNASSPSGNAMTPSDEVDMPRPTYANSGQSSPVPQQESAPLSRTTERILALMNEHDRAMKRIDKRHNK